MKNLLPSVLFLLLAAALPAQCFGVYPFGTISAGPAVRCSPSGQPGPWVSPGSTVVSTIGMVRVNWSELPLTAATPQFPACFVAFDAFLQLVPIALPGGCVAIVSPGLVYLPCSIDSLQAGCQTGAVLNFPPNPALAGLVIFGQGFMEDGAGGWSSSDAFRITLQ